MDGWKPDNNEQFYFPQIRMHTSLMFTNRRLFRLNKNCTTHSRFIQQIQHKTKYNAILPNKERH